MGIIWEDNSAEGFWLGDDGDVTDAYVVDFTAPTILLTSPAGHRPYPTVDAAKIAAENEYATTHVVESGYRNCACCGDVVIDVTLCRLCRDAGCASSKDASGEVGFWECQRDDVWSDA